MDRISEKLHLIGQRHENAIKMTRKFDKYGFNRQYLRKPLSRRNPFPRDHLPFVSDFSIGSSMHNAATTKGPGPLKGAVDKGFKEAHRAYQKAKREATKALRKEAKKIKKSVKSHLIEELEGAAIGAGMGFLYGVLRGGAVGGAAGAVTGAVAGSFEESVLTGGFEMVGQYGSIGF